MEFFTGLLDNMRDAHPIWQFLSVVLVAAIPFLEAYIAAPAGIAVGFPVALTIIAAIIGNWLTVAAVVLLSDKLQTWMQKRREKKQGGENSEGRRVKRAGELFHKYGVPGVAFIGPLLIGNHIGAFISIISGASRRNVMLWQTISIIVWALGAGLIVALGADFIRR